MAADNTQYKQHYKTDTQTQQAFTASNLFILYIPHVKKQLHTVSVTLIHP